MIFHVKTLGLVKDYNGTDLVQSKKYIEMNCSNYINRFLESHGWDVASDQSDPAPTTRTNLRTLDLWMDAVNNINRGNDNNDNANKNVTHAAVASVTTSGLSSVNKFTSAPDLSDDEFVVLQLRGKNEKSDFALIETSSR